MSSIFEPILTIVNRVPLGRSHPDREVEADLLTEFAVAKDMETDHIYLPACVTEENGESLRDF